MEKRLKRKKVGKKKFIQIITTVGKKEEAESICRALLEKKLAACVQIVGRVESHYWWEGKIEKDREFLVFIKTKEALFESVEKVIKENHSYQVPEIISLPILKGSKDYLKWIEKEIIEKDDWKK